MTMNNPKQINKAVYFVDERNQWCDECSVRLSPDAAMGTMMTPQTSQDFNCTECTSVAAGTHPELPKNKPFTQDERNAILTAINIASGNTWNYVAGGQLSMDYDDSSTEEWNQVCDEGVQTWSNLADVCSKLDGDDGVQKAACCRCLDLVQKFKEARSDETEEAGS